MYTLLNRCCPQPLDSIASFSSETKEDTTIPYLIRQQWLHRFICHRLNAEQIPELSSFLREKHGCDDSRCCPDIALTVVKHVCSFATAALMEARLACLLLQSKPGRSGLISGTDLFLTLHITRPRILECSCVHQRYTSSSFSHSLQGDFCTSEPRLASLH
jgi:hypothetical protein